LVNSSDSLVAVDWWPNANEGGYYYNTGETNCWCQDSCDSCAAWGEAVVDDEACPATCYGMSCDYIVQSEQASSCEEVQTMWGCECSGCACGKDADYSYYYYISDSAECETGDAHPSTYADCQAAGEALSAQRQQIQPSDCSNDPMVEVNGDGAWWNTVPSCFFRSDGNCEAAMGVFIFRDCADSGVECSTYTGNNIKGICKKENGQGDGDDVGGDATILAITQGFGVLPDSCSPASYSYSFDTNNDLACYDHPTAAPTVTPVPSGTMSPTGFAANCFEIDSEDDGFYDIYPEGGDGDPVTVYCDMVLGADYYKCDDCNDFWRYHPLSWSSTNSYSYSFDWHPNVGYLDGCGEWVEKSNADSLQECWEKCENVDDTVGVSWGYGMCYCFTGGNYWYDMCNYCVSEDDLNYGVAVRRGTSFPGDCDFADHEYQHSCPAGMDPIIPRSRGHWARSV